jgi:hypothetical protein
MALFYIFACSSTESELVGQDPPAAAEESLIYLEPDVAAEPAGGIMEYRRHLAKNIIYPEKAKKEGIQGKIYIQFVIDEQGKVIPNVLESGKIAPPPPPPKDGAVAPRTSTAEGIVVVGYRTVDGAKLDDYTEEQKQWLVDEAIRVIQLPYEWSPAMKDGKAVKTQWTVPIQFKLQ